MKKTLKILENALYTIILFCFVILLIYFSINIAHWNGTHDGIAEAILIILGFFTAYFPIRVIFDKNVRKNKFYIITAITCLSIFALMILLNFLFRCPYCNSWSLAPA